MKEEEREHESVIDVSNSHSRTRVSPHSQNGREQERKLPRFSLPRETVTHGRSDFLIKRGYWEAWEKKELATLANQHMNDFGRIDYREISRFMRRTPESIRGMLQLMGYTITGGKKTMIDPLRDQERMDLWTREHNT